MTVENSKGEKEILVDHQSFAAGYRQAIIDIRPQPSFLPVLLSLGLLFFLIHIFEGWKHE